jgi:tRNA-dihydrouridine synthase A
MNHHFCIAPMLDWTDRHDRYFLRQISRKVMLYTEMVTTAALIHGDRGRLLAFNPEERPLALQLGGSDPRAMAQCVCWAEQAGYDEVNINVGCPSDRVQSGQFGASLMATPQIVAQCVAEMSSVSALPITVKHRIGIDDQDSDADLERFVQQVSTAGCKTFIVHARKAWLKGLSPKENRDIPPLDYARVYRLKKEHPELEIVINGGIKTLDQAAEHLVYVDGVMLGREAYHNPYILADVDRRFFSQEQSQPSRNAILQSLLPYIETELNHGVRLNKITRHLMGLFHGQKGARAWRRVLSECANQTDAGLDVIEAAWEHVR